MGRIEQKMERRGPTSQSGLRGYKMKVNMKFVFFLIITAASSYLVYGYMKDIPLPDIDLHEWWGPKEMMYKQDTRIRPFRIKFNESMIMDLKHRLQTYRPSAPPLEGVAFEYGFNSKVLDKWLNYWAEEYPFRERENFLNQFPQYKTNIQGLDIHFIRVKAKDTANKEVVPLLILHGWPGSVREFYEAIPDLIAVSRERDFAVEIIAPSLPGFGFSDAAVRPGLGVDKAAVIFRNLMHRLGYKKYYIQGGDMGAFICNDLATLFPDEVLGYHTNALFTLTPTTVFLTFLGAVNPSFFFGNDVKDRVYPLSKKLAFYMEESGYMHEQATKPDSLGIGLSDSPAGLAGYILEKFITGTMPKLRSVPDGGLTKFFMKEQLVDNLMMYWTSNAMTTAMRMYAETFNLRYLKLRLNEIESRVPFCAIQARYEIIYMPRWMAKLKFPNYLNETVLPDGGHFLALEKPHVFAKNVLDAITRFRNWWQWNGDHF